MRFLVHPGFHKTGTSSVQAYVARNRAVLEPRLRILTMEDFPRAVTAARRHSTDPAPKRLDSYAEGLREGLAPLDRADPRPVFITCEKFLGWIPGRKDNWSYAAAPDFMERLVGAVKDTYPGARITLLFTTRAPEAWVRSVYWQNLRAMRITESLEDYAPRLARAAQLDDVVAQVRARLGDRAEVQAHRLEALRDRPLGPFGAMLEGLKIDGGDLPSPGRYNMQPRGAAEELLALNRSELDDTALEAAKRRLIRDYQASGVTRETGGAAQDEADRET
jgi:hypothetical protein